MQGRDGWGWGALTKGGRGVRKEEEEERKKLGGKGGTYVLGRKQTTGDQRRGNVKREAKGRAGNPRTLWLVFGWEHHECVIPWYV